MKTICNCDNHFPQTAALKANTFSLLATGNNAKLWKPIYNLADSCPPSGYPKFVFGTDYAPLV